MEIFILLVDLQIGIIKDKYKLIWNENTRKYECNTLLKQGYYNYLYILKG